MPVYLDRAELAAVLAGLRLLQQASSTSTVCRTGFTASTPMPGPG